MGARDRLGDGRRGDGRPLDLNAQEREGRIGRHNDGGQGADGHRLNERAHVAKILKRHGLIGVKEELGVLDRRLARAGKPDGQDKRQAEQHKRTGGSSRDKGEELFHCGIETVCGATLLVGPNSEQMT